MTRHAQCIWTSERDALLRELVASGVSRHDSIAPLAALPGPAITNHKQIAYRMHALGLRLTKERRREIWGVSIWKQRTYSYTPERRAYLEQAYPANVPKDEIMAALAAMDGPPLAGWDAIISYATKIGLRRPPRVRDVAREKERRRLAAIEFNKRRTARNAKARVRKPRKVIARPVKEARPAKVVVVKMAAPQEPSEFIEPSPEIADAVTEARYFRVKDALRRRGADPAALAKAHGLPLREAFRLAGEVRREMRP